MTGKGYLTSSWIIALMTFGQVSMSQALQSSSRFQRVIYLVLENEDAEIVIKNPLFKKWADQGAYFKNFFAETHPSQPNYISMIAGDTLGVTEDKNVNLNGRHLGDLLEERGLDWRVYAENYPGNCFLDKKSGHYARRHVPFLSFINVQSNPQRCAKILGFESFISDWRLNKLPAFNMVIPNNMNNGHDTKLDFTANWIKKTFDSILSDSSMMANTLFIITFDEGDRSPQNQIYTVMIGSPVIPGSVSDQTLNHNSLIRLFEEEWGLGTLGKGDFSSPSILQIWKN